MFSFVLQDESLPAGWDGKLNAFQRLLIIRALRDEKVFTWDVNPISFVYIDHAFVAGRGCSDAFHLGQDRQAFHWCASVRPCVFFQSKKDSVWNQIRKIRFEKSNCSLIVAPQDSAPLTPIVFVLSTGADPTLYLYNLAREMSFLERLRMISLGQVGLTCFEQSIVVNISLFLYSQVFCIVLLCSESSKDYYSKLRFFKQKMFNYRRCSMTLVQHRKWLRWSVQCAGAGANCRDYDCFWKRRWRMGVPAGDVGILPPQSPNPSWLQSLYQTDTFPPKY